MTRELEAPTGEDPVWDDLYSARGANVAIHRPVFTGDVFSGISVQAPRSEAKTKSVMVLQHPCAMRPDGVSLASNILVAEVHRFPILERARWTTSGKLMPLPDLLPSVTSSKKNQAAFFDDTYHVHRDDLDLNTRVACLSESGLYLLLQRWVFHSSRVVVPASDFEEMNGHLVSEADIIETWCEDAAAYDVDLAQARADAAAWLGEELGGRSRQHMLRESALRSGVRRGARSAIKALYGPAAEVTRLRPSGTAPA